MMEKKMIQPDDLSGNLFNQTKDLFNPTFPHDGTTSTAFVPPFSPSELLLATNTENLKSMISSGMIHPVEGYRKYYHDLSRFSPGHLPLFVDVLPATLLSQCREESDMDVAILSIKLPQKALQSNVAYTIDDGNQLILAPLEAHNPVKALFYRGILPLSTIATIYLESTAAKKRFLAYRYANFAPEIFPIKVQAKRFNQLKGDNAIMACFSAFQERAVFISPPKNMPSKEPYPSMRPLPSGSSGQLIRNPQKNKIDDDNTPFFEIDARGGFIAVLMTMLPPVTESRNLLFYVLTPPPVDYLKLTLLPKSIKYLNNWLWNNPVKTDDVDAILLWHLLHLLAPADPLQGLTSAVFLDELRQRFENSEDLRNAPSTPYEELKQRFFKRFDQIQNAVDQHTDPADFFLDETLKSDMMRALLLFLLYQKNIWTIYENQALINGWNISAEVMLFSGIMNGVWQGWQSLDEMIRPQEKKGIFGISNFMADWERRWRNETELCRNETKSCMSQTEGDVSEKIEESPMAREKTSLFGNQKEISVSGSCTLWEKKILRHIPWSIKSQLGQFARNLAKERNWAALQTKLSIPPENLSQLSYQKEGEMTLTMIGDVTFKEHIDKSQFFEALDEIELTDEEKRNFPHSGQ